MVSSHVALTVFKTEIRAFALRHDLLMWAQFCSVDLVLGVDLFHSQGAQEEADIEKNDEMHKNYRQHPLIKDKRVRKLAQ